jgi:hypothetical protein
LFITIHRNISNSVFVVNFGGYKGPHQRKEKATEAAVVGASNREVAQIGIFRSYPANKGVY